MSTPLIRRAVFWALALGAIVLLAALLVPALGRVSASARRTVDGSNLRQIGQAAFLYATEHNDSLPAAADVWDYARLLADETGLDDPMMWLSKNDPATDTAVDIPAKIVGPGTKPRPIDPAFRQLKPGVAVALGKLTTRMPGTTPVAWTRGLLPDGTWSAHSPYGTTGGYITFLGGNTAFYKGLNYGGGELVRFDGKGQTSNILEALPPGTRIGEYTPTDEEKTAWADAIIWRQKMGTLNTRAPAIFLVLLWLPFVAISLHRQLKKRPGAFTVLLCPVILTGILVAILPDCWR